MTLVLPIDLTAAIVSNTSWFRKVQFKPPWFAGGQIDTQGWETGLFSWLALSSFFRGQKEKRQWNMRNQKTVSGPFLALGGVKQWMSVFTLSGPPPSTEKKKDLYWADLFIRKVWNFCWRWLGLCSWSVALGFRGACIFSCLPPLSLGSNLADAVAFIQSSAGPF